jgi:large subunit ribosomal protein L10
LGPKTFPNLESLTIIPGVQINFSKLSSPDLILSKFAKTNESLKLLGGIMGNEVLDQAAVQNVANLPTLDEARANIVGILAAPASILICILLARSEKMSNLAPENSEK